MTHHDGERGLDRVMLTVEVTKKARPWVRLHNEHACANTLGFAAAARQNNTHDGEMDRTAKRCSARIGEGSGTCRRKA